VIATNAHVAEQTILTGMPDGVQLDWVRNGKDVDWLHYLTVPKDSKQVFVPPWKIDDAPRDAPTP
jgi:hypothetical protein